MTFAAPVLLLALAGLPLLWWLLRATPPTPRTVRFPAIRLLSGLQAADETPARTPWWLLLLRVLAAALVILGLARPVVVSGDALPGSGPVLLVLDDGWSAARNWPARLRAADAVLDRADRAGRPVALLVTAPGPDGAAPAIGPSRSVAELRPMLAAARPRPWPVDRAAATAALRGWNAPGAAIAYLADGLAAPGDTGFAAALSAIGPVDEIRSDAPAVQVLRPPGAEPERLLVRAARLARPEPEEAGVLAEGGDGRAFGHALLRFAPGAAEAETPLVLPPELRNQLTRLVLRGPASAASVVLLDEGSRRRPVGLVTAGEGADAPLTGALFYVRQAMRGEHELREGDVATLLSRELSVVVLVDRALDPAEAKALGEWVDRGGLLIRFAGPRTAAAEEGGAPGAPAEAPAGAASRPDPLLPVRLLGGERRLGGALSWSQPTHLAPFPPESPFAGLPVPDEVAVTRQVLAEPSSGTVAHSWARLADGTPLVTEASHGRGRVVLFHVTANADWSNLPLSGLFPAMLRRLTALAAGVAAEAGTAPLAPAETLDGYGLLGPPPPSARPVAANEIGRLPASPAHPPGFYGAEAGRRALNLADELPALQPAAPVPGARRTGLDGAARDRAIGPPLVGLALLLLGADLILSLALRGLLRRAAAAAVIALAAMPAARAQAPSPALATRLAYVVSGDPAVDAESRSGLAALSEAVNRRTAAVLAEPAAVVPGRDDLSFYPLLYWPITAGARDGAAGATTALNAYMRGGGIVLIDTRDGGGPAMTDALRRAAAGLDVPPLTPLTDQHVLAHAFYLLHDFPGRTDDGTVWVARDVDRSNDFVSPVVIGGSDWAGAWARGPDGQPLFAVSPGGARQRDLAYRFGVNLVIYALTGNYKGDQVHVPALLDRMGDPRPEGGRP